MGQERVYNRIPFTISALAYFLWRYIFNSDFSMAAPGWSTTSCRVARYRFLSVGAKAMELERAIAHLTDKREILRSCRG